jgi:triosephosphate isomerase
VRRQLIAGNWKMHKTRREGRALVQGLLEGLGDVPAERTLLVCPPATLLHPLREVIGDRRILLGAQDMSWERQGAMTGEISPVMLLDAGCTHVLVGHSERRHVLMEKPEFIRQKLEAARENGLKPIFCIGEKLEERRAKRTTEILSAQLEDGFIHWKEPPTEGNMIIAYEPVWAIGTGVTATPEQAQEAHAFIRELLGSRWGETGRKIPILYGGSVKPENAGTLLDLEDVDGVLVGGASLEAASFLGIAKAGGA